MTRVRTQLPTIQAPIRRASIGEALDERRKLADRQVDPKRQCGRCTICCTIPDIPQIGKPANTPCQHLTPDGCGIYETRPDVCREFYCNWRFGLGDPTQRPDRVGFYSTGAEGVTGIKLHMLGRNVDHWKRFGWWRKVVDRLVAAGGSVFIIAHDLRKVVTRDPAILKAAAAETPGSAYPIQCAWCKAWRSDDDRVRHEIGGEPVSHTICTSCAADAQKQIDELPDAAAADGGNG